MAKLLLVEDDNNLREIYEARLQAEGYQIVSAKDGEEALVVAKAEKPDLVISDVMMPKISGFEMLDILRNTPELQGVKVIMLTALGQTDDQKRADKLGADRYLVKSQVTLEDIVKTAHELLGDQPGDAPAPPTDPAPADNAQPAATAPEPKPEPPSEPAAPPEPVAAPPVQTPPEPTPEPVAKPDAPADKPQTDPEPQPEPKPEPDSTSSDKAAKPAAQEEADVEAKIEDFVAGATSEPTAPPAGDQQAGSVVKPGGDDGSSTSDDKLMADAVETLVASTDDGKQAAADEDATAETDGGTRVTVTTGKPAAQQSEPVVSAPAEDKQSEAATDQDKQGEEAPESGGGVKKIIKPIDSPPKKDINQLLAEEEAKEGLKPGTPVVGSASAEPEDRAAGAPMARPSDNDGNGPGAPDPGSIAL